MKHKRQTLSKTDDEESKDEFKGDGESQSSSEFGPKTKNKSELFELTFHINTINGKHFPQI